MPKKNGQKNQKKEIRAPGLPRPAMVLRANQPLEPKKIPAHVKLSKCANDYARALINPFTGPLACIPSYPAAPTRKLRPYAGGIMSTGTAGFGFVMSDPYFAAFSDANCVLFSNAAYTGTTFAPLGAGVSGAMSNSEYTSASFGVDPNLNDWRPVAHGIRIRYVGTELARGGQLIAFHDPQHTTLSTRTLASIDGEDERKRFDIDRKWKNVVYRPYFDSDVQFASGITTWTGIATDLHFWMGACVQAPDPAVSISFEFECYTVMEVLGRNVRGKTPSHVDFLGFGAAHATTQMGTVLLPYSSNDPKLEEKRMVGAVARYVVEASTSVTHPMPSSGSSNRAKSTNSNDIDWWDVATNVAGAVLPSVLDWLF